MLLEIHFLKQHAAGKPWRGGQSSPRAGGGHLWQDEESVAFHFRAVIDDHALELGLPDEVPVRRDAGVGVGEFKAAFEATACAWGEVAGPAFIDAESDFAWVWCGDGDFGERDLELVRVQSCGWTWRTTFSEGDFGIACSCVSTQRQSGERWRGVFATDGGQLQRAEAIAINEVFGDDVLEPGDFGESESACPMKGSDIEDKLIRPSTEPAPR